jgi:hypothetical protein
MTQFGDPGPGHRNALDAVAEARQHATAAVSKMRQVGPPPHHPRLAPAGDDPALATIATQAVVDYLVQLRPYRGHSATWNVAFGQLQLPEHIQESQPGAGWNRNNARRLYVCRQPTLYVENVSDFVEVANMTVQYSSKMRRGTHPFYTSGGGGRSALHDPTTGGVADRWRVDTDEYGTLAFSEKRHIKALLFGDLSPAAALEHAELVEEKEADEEEADDQVTLGDPDVGGRDAEVKSFNLVFNAGELQRFLTLGDDVAAELDVLADLEAPDHSAAGPGGAV